MDNIIEKIESVRHDIAQKLRSYIGDGGVNNYKIVTDLLALSQQVDNALKSAGKVQAEEKGAPSRMELLISNSPSAKLTSGKASRKTGSSFKNLPAYFIWNDKLYKIGKSQDTSSGGLYRKTVKLDTVYFLLSVMSSRIHQNGFFTIPDVAKEARVPATRVQTTVGALTSINYLDQSKRGNYIFTPRAQTLSPKDIIEKLESLTVRHELLA